MKYPKAYNEYILGIIKIIKLLLRFNIIVLQPKKINAEKFEKTFKIMGIGEVAKGFNKIKNMEI